MEQLVSGTVLSSHTGYRISEGQNVGYLKVKEAYDTVKRILGHYKPHVAIEVGNLPRLAYCLVCC
jgi:hypothetical protein